MPTIITAGDASSGSSSLAGGNDGLLSIVVGPAGSKVTALSIDAAGTPTFIKQPILSGVLSSIRVASSNGFGSTNTVIKRFINVLLNTGADITYADSATLGATFTVNTTGIYGMAFSCTGPATNAFGISRNSSQLTTAVNSITQTDRLVSALTNGGNLQSVSVQMLLTAGDVIRAHTDGQASSTVATENFTVTRIG